MNTESNQREDALPLPSHLVAEFYLWLWWMAEENEGAFNIEGDIGKFELWVDDRLSFRLPDGSKPQTVMTGDNPSVAKEARAAVAGGKVVHDLRVSIRRDDREFALTLDGTTMDLKKAKIPQAVEGSSEEALHDRMFLYEEIMMMLTGLFQQFTRVRIGKKWSTVTVPKIKTWIAAGRDAT